MSVSDTDTSPFFYYQDNFIDSEDIFNSLLEYTKTEPKGTNLTIPWPERLIPDGVGEVRMWRVDDDDINDYLCFRLASVFEILRDNTLDFTFTVTEWTDNSFIPFHNDKHKWCAVTCYLKNDCDYGGEFLLKPYDDPTIGMFLDPIPNRALLIRLIDHSVSKIHHGKRVTLQCWCERKGD